MEDLTIKVGEALRTKGCTVIPNTSVFLSDRPLNASKPFGQGDKGNSDFDVGHSFNLWEVLSRRMAISRARISLNNIRIFGPVSARGCLHYHGYSEEELAASIDAFHFIIMTVHVIARYDSQSGEVQMDDRVPALEVKGKPGLVLIHERDGLLKIEPLEIGDTIVVPSSAYHTFSAAPGVFASYGAIEVCDNPAKMYQTHYESEERNPNAIIANTIRHLGGFEPADLRKLSLADVPDFGLYVEER